MLEEILKDFEEIMQHKFRPLLHLLPQLENLKEKVTKALSKITEEIEQEDSKMKKGKKNG